MPAITVLFARPDRQPSHFSEINQSFVINVISNNSVELARLVSWRDTLLVQINASNILKYMCVGSVYIMILNKPMFIV